MSKYSVIVILVFILFTSFFLITIKRCTKQEEIKASVSSYELITNAYFAFNDSTPGAKEWLWEFGNNDFSEQKKGRYSYSQSGKYRIKLTVNNELERFFVINVVDPPRAYGNESHISIEAPIVAIQDEIIVFISGGDANMYRWEFGETGMLDSREKNPIYSYSRPGIYDVLLTTDKSLYPIRHRIEIIANYSEENNDDVLSIMALDIKRKLQMLSDGNQFNRNYNLLLNKYLCNNSNALVIINNQKHNDFYSYCQGLKITGRSNRTVIENVVVDTGGGNNPCISKIYVIQYDGI